MGKKENSYINVLKGIGALMVVIIHGPKTNFISTVIVPCFLALFFWASGYTYNYKKNYIPKLFINTLKLLLELGTFDIIMRKVVFLLVYNSRIDIQSIMNDYIGLFISIANNPKYFDFLWFFPCMFVAKSIFHLSHLVNNKKISFIISLLCSIVGFYIWLYPQRALDYLWHLPVALFMQIVLEFGYLCKLHDNVEKKTVMDSFITALIPVLVIIFCTLILHFPMDADLHIGSFTNGYLYCLHLLVELPIVIFIAKRIDKNKIWEYMGKNSAYFFAYQIAYIELFKGVIFKFQDDMNEFLKMIVIVPLVCMSVYLTVECRKEIVSMLSKLMKKDLSAKVIK